MFKIRSIAVRLILAISLTVAVACAILGTFSIAQQRSLTQLALDQQLKLQYDSVIAAIDFHHAAPRWSRHSGPASRSSASNPAARRSAFSA
jgi:methyl-accepting chemotaxis protein